MKNAGYLRASRTLFRASDGGCTTAHRVDSGVLTSVGKQLELSLGPPSLCYGFVSSGTRTKESPGVLVSRTEGILAVYNFCDLAEEGTCLYSLAKNFSTHGES